MLRQLSSEDFPPFGKLQLDLEEMLAVRPPVDIAAWARSLGGERKASISPLLAVTQTIPIMEDISLESFD